MTPLAPVKERRPAPRSTPRWSPTCWTLAALTLAACGQAQRPAASPVDATEEVADELGEAEPYVPPAPGVPAGAEQDEGRREGDDDAVGRETKS